MRLQSSIITPYLFSVLKPLAFDDTTIKAFYANEEDVPEGIKSFYAKKGDRWELNVSIDGIEGVKTFTDFEKLNSALRKERNDHKLIRDKFKPIGDRDLNELLTASDRITELEEQLEAAAGDDPKKIDKLVEARIKARLAPIERERDQLKTQLETASVTIKTFEGEKRTRAIHDSVREASVKAKLLPEALDDALMLAERVMDVAEDGNVSVKEGSGYGIGLNPTGWLIEMQQKRPHWWGPTNGGGAGGNRGGGNGIKNPWTNENWNMTDQGALVIKDPGLAAQLAASAGTKIGGPRPAVKK